MKTILNLTIKRKWLDMIVNRQKREEYRDPGCRQLRRYYEKLDAWMAAYRKDIWDSRGALAIYRAGYRDDSPAVVVELGDVVPPDSITKTPTFRCKHPEWGEPRTAHWTIEIRSVVRFGPYSEMRKWLEERK